MLSVCVCMLRYLCRVCYCIVCPVGVAVQEGAWCCDCKLVIWDYVPSTQYSTTSRAQGRRHAEMLQRNQLSTDACVRCWAAGQIAAVSASVRL